MITAIVLLVVAAAIVAFTVVAAVRDGYGRIPARMERSNLERPAEHTVSASRLA